MLYAPERILVAPSGFKESLSAIEVADAIAAGIRRVLPGSRVDTFPVPDGGEGTVEILAQRHGAVSHTETVTGPVGQKVQATWVESGIWRRCHGNGILRGFDLGAQGYA